MPYGYTVVDHPQKNIWKGSQILSLSELYAKAREDKVRELIHELANTPGNSFHTLQTELERLGLKLNQQGRIRIGSETISLSSNIYNKLLYADRLNLANSIKINSQYCKSLLGKLMMVNPVEIQNPIGKAKDFEGLKAVVDYLDQSNKWEQGLKHFKLSLLKNEGHVYLFSSGEPALLDLNKLMGRNLNFGQTQIVEVGLQAPDFTEKILQVPKDNLLAALADIIAESQEKAQEQKNKKKNQPSHKL